eukprot:CAMPEP_0170508938 /NCGR_PEP_ID=MMETSP0208-20121228/63866_1 /TAXON_ID=197538 /ORGANISM="Strombidium inclinatum, Strain S3" /LENGTH=94 /DNA_ID=CAMNT_0010792115 /DNA_START=1742 /DNA_END=2026 /DNA_ORIENTATION=+
MGDGRNFVEAYVLAVELHVSLLASDRFEARLVALAVQVQLLLVTQVLVDERTLLLELFFLLSGEFISFPPPGTDLLEMLLDLLVRCLVGSSADL